MINVLNFPIKGDVVEWVYNYNYFELYTPKFLLKKNHYLLKY